MTLLVCLLLFSVPDDIARLQRASSVAGERICAAEALAQFYARRASRPAWDQENLAALVNAIDRAGADGLQPARYHRARLAEPLDEAARDVLATDAFLLLATHLSRGVVDPQFSRPDWCPLPGQLDLAAVLEAALDEHTVADTLARLTVRHEGYTRLRSALALYREIAENGGWPEVAGGPSLRLGDRGARVVELRARLAREPIAVNPPASPLIGTSDVFDADLDALVRHFQSHHGLAADGVVGRETLRELNVSAAERAGQLVVNLERWRWLPEQLGDEYAFVNIAAFRLDVFEGGRNALSMKTIVGKDYTRTPFFAARITQVVVNPWWNVPDSIAAKELWPKQKRDGSYLAREHMMVSGGRIRQRPGPWNALGRLKFDMPNAFDVYLHDTPARSLFEQPVRAFSHGCIRLAQPLDLAVHLLRDQPQWTRRAIEEAIESGRERSVGLTRSVPVYILYWTAWVGDDGHVEFHRDHYRRDAALASALN
jgi:murein L,D-transpeptidase YcbB/YkuD